MRLHDREIGLRRNDPPGCYDSTLEKNLVFRGRIVIEVEDTWNDERTLGTNLDGEILNRIAIYASSAGGDGKRFVGEQCRYNPRVILKSPEIVASGGLPLMSLAEEFDEFDRAVSWILAGPLIEHGQIRGAFELELKRHGGGISRRA